MIISDILAKKLALFEYGKKIFDHIRNRYLKRGQIFFELGEEMEYKLSSYKKSSSRLRPLK